MTNERPFPELNEFLAYLAKENVDEDRIPALAALSQELKISTATLREQLEVARTMGLVEVRPKTGIKRLPYRFTPAVLNSLSYATAIDSNYFFQQFSDFRNHIEAAYWRKAVSHLAQDDYEYLEQLIVKAFEKLNGTPIQIPHNEHKALHLSIYKRLNNPFVTGILEAYWEAYEAIGLDVYADIGYLHKVWNYHRKMVNAICNGEIETGYRALIEHTDLLLERSPSTYKQRFE